MFRDWINEHQFEMKVMAIGLVFSFVIALGATGNLHEAFARCARH